jgi:hypothetical protein
MAATNSCRSCANENKNRGTTACPEPSIPNLQSLIPQSLISNPNLSFSPICAVQQIHHMQHLDIHSRAPRT